MPTKTPIDLARAAKEHAKKALAKVPGVVGIGLTKINDQYALKVNLEAELPKTVRAPLDVDGVPVTYAVTGPIRPR